MMTSFHRDAVRWPLLTLALFIGVMLRAEIARAQTPGRSNAGQKPATRQVPSKSATTKAAVPKAPPVAKPAQVVKPAPKNVVPTPVKASTLDEDADSKPATPDEKPAPDE